MTQLTLPLTIAPAQVLRGCGILADIGSAIARLGQRPLIVGGDRTLALVDTWLGQTLADLAVAQASYGADCSDIALQKLQAAATQHQADVIIGWGGGKALDTAKLLAHQQRLPVVTVPTSAATCAAWTALSNVYSEQGAFQYDVGLPLCPNLLVVDYDLIATASRRTLVAGIGDGLAKWYEASISSGHSQKTLIIAAVQQARVLRDLLFQKAEAALKEPAGADWREVVDAAVLLAGVVGGLGGAQCRTVAAHAVHNGLTHLAASHGVLHGEKVAYGILVQLRLEEMGQGSSLAASARQQLIQFYQRVGLPKTLEDLGLGQISLAELRQAAEVACRQGSDIHHLPFSVTPEQLVAAMVSTAVPLSSRLSRSQSEVAQTAQEVES
ncbi:MAG: iron-containing alcohol dehydrogenase family protein [Leptolyngbyaceae cyanobacterium SM1_1_3]|nr:iron-containing alcohol dehydrogenase family protein [Leptolyngbyaceae cyanobacterium SM1_1_3]NJN04111.1 iron-containing alcohol dehydrogenase family protein [Leptolyngbyaceae cyanobacterium RM1_1_2]NJO09636.1 iron-containing alcohol dehydrogenase family protein [Leptolyngbyaceae cyanobacterium SL_1_1]